MPTFSPIRASFVLVLIAAALVGMTGRVAYLQTYGRHNTIHWAERQQHTSEHIMARRGPIFDRNGLAMASSLQTTTLYVDPKFMLAEYQRNGRNLNQMDEDLRRLCRLVDAKADDLTQILSAQPDSRYLKIAENLDENLQAEVENLKIPGVAFEPVCVRWYPMGPIASHVLGTVGKDGRGLEGIEMKYDSILAGKNGFRRIEKDARRRPIGVDADDYSPPSHGRPMVLTIDANIQMLAEEELASVCEQHKAKCGEVIVIDPKTGDILALANWPTFDPQNLSDSVKDQRLNRAIVVPYEPGSTLKPFIMGPSLAWHVTRPNEVWPIRSITYTPYGTRHVTDVHFYGELCTWDILVKSSNIGMSMLSERMGNPSLYRALSGFGFGQKTGIELPGENHGRLNPLKQWTHYSTESIAQGYELMITPLQLARAFSVYANGGRLIQPRIIQGSLDADGNVTSNTKPVSLESFPQVIDPTAVEQIRQMLTDVMVRGTAQKKGSKVWNIFGKTGTAHISRGRSGYASDLYNSSFICGAPLENPRIVVVMAVHEPDRSLGYYGGTVSAPAAVKVVERTLGYLQVPASPPLPLPPASVTPYLKNYDARLYAAPQASAE